MKAKVNKDVCIGCGACTSIAPDVFEIGDDGLAEVVKDNKKPWITDEGILVIGIFDFLLNKNSLDI